jgi:hypothetical protein
MIKNLARNYAVRGTIVSGLFLLLVVACSSRGAAPPAAVNVNEPNVAGEQQAQRGQGQQQSGQQGQQDDLRRDQSGDKSAILQPAQQRIVIKNAALFLTVKSPEETLASVGKLAEEMGGWVVTSKSYKTTTSSGAQIMQAAIMIRVPAERFTDVLTRLKTSAVSVDSEDISGQDVTREYTDLSSQLTNLEATEVQLRGILEAAKGTAEVLNVQRELSRVRGEIEVIKGQIRYYQESAAFSSISLTLKADEETKPLEIAGFRPLETAKSAFEMLVNILQSIVTAVIWVVVVVVPLVVIFGIPGWLIIRTINRRTQRIGGSPGGQGGAAPASSAE